MELLHKAALYAVLTFVIVGAAITLAGPTRVSGTALRQQATEQPDVVSGAEKTTIAARESTQKTSDRKTGT